MINLGIIFISTAAMLYSISIWTEKFKKGLKTWIIYMFGTAFCCDIIGTSTMFLVATNKFSLATHSICGYLALTIMFLHFIWALKAIKNPAKYQHLFTKWSVVAWVVWVITFISGIPKI